MNRMHKRLLASLLAVTLLTLPGGAWAAPAADPAQPAETGPVEPTEPTEPAPADEVPAEQLAEVKVSREQAIAAARQHFTIPAELGEPNVGIRQSRDGATWSVEWRSAEKERNQQVINVDVDAVTARVTSYSSWSSEEEPLALSHTMAEARKVGETWFAKLVPAELQPALRYVDVPLSASYWGGTEYRFIWERVEQGYPVMDDGVTIAIDARTGALADYRLNWRDALTFEPLGGLLNRQRVNEELGPYLRMTLQYRYFTERGTDEGEWRLVYMPANNLPFIDQAGRLVGRDGTALEADPEPRLVEAADQPYQKPTAPLDREAALAIAQAATGRTDPPTSSSYGEYGGEVKSYEWDFSWTQKSDEEKGTRELSVTIDAMAGVITRLGSWGSDDGPLAEDEEPAVSREQAETIAIAFLRANRPDLSGRILYQPTHEEEAIPKDYRPSTYSFRFSQLQNGLPVNGRELRVEVDARTGAVRYFWSDSSHPGEAEFPAADGALHAEKALDAYLAAEGIRLSWVTLWSREQEVDRPPQVLWAPEGRLPVGAIDAFTGAPLDWEGRDLVAAAQRPTDIAGHFAEREIELLWNRGVFDLAEGKFSPDEPATTAELARWIVLAEGLRPYPAADFGGMGASAPLAAKLDASAESPYFGAAFQAGIMRPEDFPEGADLQGPVSRELFALWAVRAMGYSRITTMDRRVELTFADGDQVGAKYANAVALLAGLDILSGDGENRVNPQAQITRAAAAKILYAVTAEPRK